MISDRKPLRQRLGRGLADVLDAEGEQKARQHRQRRGDRFDQVFRPSGGDLPPLAVSVPCHRARRRGAHFKQVVQRSA